MKKKWGQHLLIDKKVAEREVEYAEISSKDIVLEVGPGRGILTELTAKRAKEVIAIEIDERFVEYLRSIMPENVKIIHADVLDVNIKKFKFNKVVSNLPFKISSPFTFKLLDTNFDKAVIIYQKEFAKRLVAQAGNKDYSRLSVVMYYKTYSRILEEVPRDAFRPKPKVDGAIVEIIPRKKPAFYVEDEDFFEEFLVRTFSSRRKTLRKVVKKYYNLEINNEFGNKRIEEIEPEDIGRLCNEIFCRLKSK